MQSWFTMRRTLRGLRLLSLLASLCGAAYAGGGVNGLAQQDSLRAGVHAYAIGAAVESAQIDSRASSGEGVVRAEASPWRVAEDWVAGRPAAQQISPWFLFAATLIALSLGGLHALEQGDHWTISAGERLSSRDRLWRAVQSVGAYTAGLLGLGAVALVASRYLVREQMSVWRGLLSGLMMVAMGVSGVLRRLTGVAAAHTHLPRAGASGRLRALFRARHLAGSGEGAPPAGEMLVARGSGEVQGFPGGIADTLLASTVLAVLLGVFALDRGGLLLLIAFSVGFASVLLGSHLVRPSTGLRVDGVLHERWLSVVSAGGVTALGLMIVLRSIAATQLTRTVFNGYLSRERLGPVLFLTGLGLVLGMRHSTDADHVVAISTIVGRQRSIRGAALIGSVWGLGHTIMIFAVGALIILAGIKIPPRVGLAMEFTVALMLILLGGLNLTGVTQRWMARYGARAEDVLPEGMVRDAARVGGRGGERPGAMQFLRPLVIGLVHGLAGSAAVALLVLSTIHNPVWATIYLLIFGFGTVLGMMIMTAAIAVPLTYAGDRFSNLSRYFGITSGVISMCFGLFLVYQLGFVGGLFTSHPHWTPQ